MDNYKTPGQYIEALLADRGWTQRTLAIILGVDITGINKIVSGKKPVTAEMALLLETVFEVPAEEFLELQKEYDLAKARIIARPDPGRAIRARLFGDLPISEMIKRGWLEADDIRDVSDVESALKKFFHSDSIEDIEVLPYAAKKTLTSSPPTPAQLAWIYRVKEIASELIVARYSPSSARNVIPRLSNLMLAAEEARHVPRILAEAGIRLVIAETISGAKIDGVCFWLDDFSPVIGLSLRYDRIDNFWFVLRHELEHVLRRRGSGTIMLDTELEGDRAGTGEDLQEEERMANEAATEFCIPQKTMDSFIARKSPFFNERDILGLAATLKIHPGIVAGQLQHKTARYDRFRQYLTKVRSAICPSAVVDGWGDIYPCEFVRK